MTRSLLFALLLPCAASGCSTPPSPSKLELTAPPLATEEDTAPPLRPPRPLDDDGVIYLLGEQPSFPRVRYLDGQISLNESCAIRVENKLSRRIPPVYVNGRPIGFC
jgi:hypothetical protein